MGEQPLLAVLVPLLLEAKEANGPTAGLSLSSIINMLGDLEQVFSVVKWGWHQGFLSGKV